ncbi:hypothetical protein [Burkholderia glumae]|uniref:hypothetical protein n=1 Tax=Burkholderia glumae TaxID=337 RepID=UPI0012970B52|nr:hypothetical protein [Burkholderia glumae]MCQ0034136.1 hypothetical protein [Burkholderia glumae]MCQ0040438.1 hypothetical protein [Burkholderia glumae]QGA41759.1 hypothetical protein GAS19_30205 [Burkholderia glumae]
MKHVDRTPSDRARGGRRRDIAAADGGAREVAPARQAPTHLARIGKRLAARDWRAALRHGWHLVLAATALSVAWWLFLWGDGERSAALHGDRHVLAVRQAIRAALHWDDAVSTLEHALTGVSLGLVGVGILQFYYFVVGTPITNPTPTPRWLQLVLGGVVTGAAALIAWRVIYGDTGVLVVGAVILVVGWSLAYPDRLRGLAFAAPGYVIALVSGLMWLNFDLSWKLQRRTATHDSIGVVLLHLLASGGTLLIVSLVAGAVTRRCRTLRPVGS